jgi:hypothetical protein
LLPNLDPQTDPDLNIRSVLRSQAGVGKELSKKA